MARNAKGFLFLVCLAMLSAFLGGCAGGKKVSRVASDSVIDLSGQWNDTDSRLVAEEMLNDCLSQAWYQRFLSEHEGKIPTIVVGKVSNKSHEHISVETFINDIKRVLINSGKVEFIAGAEQRAELRSEIDEQGENASEETAKSRGQEIGSDLMLGGSINTIVDQEGKERVIFYQVDLTLTALESHKQLWIGDKKIKKYMSRNSVSL